MTREYYEINEDAARQAKAMWSHSDYVMGSKTEEYKKAVNEAYDLVDKIKEQRPRSAEKAEHIAKKYAKKLAENYNDGFRIEMMCPSILISGAGNFPVKKKEKQNEARDRNLKEYNQILGYIDKLKDILHGNEVIKSKDADAVEMLQEKLDKLVKNQDMMKAVNAYYRKHKTLKGCPEFSEETAIKLEEALDDRKKEQHRVFMRYELQNNNSNIRSIKKRLEALKREKEQGDSEISLDKFGLDIKENKEIMRIQFFFSGRPKPAVRDVMKSKAFRWSPKNGCWQRQLTSNGRYAVKKAVEEIGKLELEDIYDEI